MGEKSELINRLNKSETEVLHFLFRDPNFKVKDVAKELFRGEGGIRTNLTAIFDKLMVPDDISNKREWIFREYSEAYQYLFDQENEVEDTEVKRDSETTEIFVAPPHPRLRFPVIIALTLLLLASIGFNIYFRIDGNNLYHTLETLQAIPSQAPQPANTSLDSELIPGATLLVDQFDNGLISEAWTIYGNQPIVNNGFAYIDGSDLLGLSAGDNYGWEDYIIHAGIVIRNCVDKQIQSKIGVRLNGSNLVPAYAWSPCDYPAGTILNIIITVQGNQMLVIENGKEVKFTDISFPGHEVGGIVVEADAGSALDYFLITSLR